MKWPTIHDTPPSHPFCGPIPAKSDASFLDAMEDSYITKYPTSSMDSMMEMDSMDCMDSQTPTRKRNTVYICAGEIHIVRRIGLRGSLPPAARARR